mgnify:FL=1
MKRKLMICAMALCICAGLTGNTGEVSVWASEGSSSDAVRIGALKGPTAMGMAQLLDEDGYDFTIAASPDEIVPMVVQDKLDIAAVPANLAATLYQKTDKDVSVLAVNTLGVLYLVENGDSVKSVEDLKGKTIYASGKGATPEYALNSVLKANGIDPEKDVTVEFKSEHAEVVSALVQDQTAVGLLPQPFVTTALMKNDKLKVALDLNKLWEDSMDDGSKLVTGVVIANNEFVQDHADKVNDFMDAYKESVDFVNSDTEAAAQIIGDHDIIAKEVAQKEKVTKLEIKEADDALKKALGKLDEVKASGKTEVQTKIAQAAEKKEADYTKESWANFAKAKRDAEMAFASETATAKQLKDAADALDIAMKALEAKKPDNNNDNNNGNNGNNNSQTPAIGSVIADASGIFNYKVTGNDTVEVKNMTAKGKAKSSVKIAKTIKANGKTYKVTAIAANALKGNKKVTSVSIGSNVEKIGKKAFANCTKLKTVTVNGNKLKTIGQSAFSGDKNLKAVNLKKVKTLKTVGKSAFKGVSKKITVRVPKNKKAAYVRIFKKGGIAANKIK